MPSKSNNNYAFGPSNTNAAISSNSHNPFINNASSSQQQQLHQPRPTPSRNLTGGGATSPSGHSPLLGSYEDRHHEDLSQNRLLGPNMSRQGSADSMGSVSLISDVITGRHRLKTDRPRRRPSTAIQPQLSSPLSLSPASLPIRIPYSLIFRLARTGWTLCEHQLERRLPGWSGCRRCHIIR
jgi:hypothetical protein